MGTPVSGWADLRERTGHAGVHLPAELAKLFPELALRGDWVWGTDEYDPMAEYMMSGVVEYLAGVRHRRLRFCHAGHGMNSYALTLQAVTDRVALFTQVGWGGVYTDQEAATALVNQAAQDLTGLLLHAEQMPTWPAQTTVVVTWSSMRKLARAWVVGPELVAAEDYPQWQAGSAELTVPAADYGHALLDILTPSVGA
jgi:hypothetical protein